VSRSPISASDRSATFLLSANMCSYDLQRLGLWTFRRALDTGNLAVARANAVELKHVGLAEALELTLLILAREPTLFRAAALRWHGRYCTDTKASLEEATAVLGLLAMLEGRRARTAAQALAGLLGSRTLLPAAEVLVRWAEGR
jgi:hypothetical protein